MTDHVLEHFLDLPEAQPSSNGNTPHTAGETYIWITRWREFQHYRPERDRGPAWIKDYPKQMLDDRYLQLTDRQRALIRDLRDVFAMCGGRLSNDIRAIAVRRSRQTRHADLLALNHAGLIEFLSRATLEQRLEQLYSSPHARTREGEVEVEEELLSPRRREDQEPSSIKCKNCGEPVAPRSTCRNCGAPPRQAGSNPRKLRQRVVCPDCELGGGHHLADCPRVQTPPTHLELPAPTTGGF